MDKATYVAQILAPIALLVTVFFSYMSWRETRNALSIQERIFTAQNSPRLRLSFVETGLMEKGFSVGLALKNFGDSDAKNLCVRIFDREFQPLEKSCLGAREGESTSTSTVAADETFPFLLNLTSPRFEPVGFIPTSAHVVDENARVKSCSEGENAAIVSILYTYENVLGARLTGVDRLLLCGRR